MIDQEALVEFIDKSGAVRPGKTRRKLLIHLLLEHDFGLAAVKIRRFAHAAAERLDHLTVKQPAHGLLKRLFLRDGSVPPPGGRTDGRQRRDFGNRSEWG